MSEVPPSEPYPLPPPPEPKRLYLAVVKLTSGGKRISLQLESDEPITIEPVIHGSAN